MRQLIVILVICDNMREILTWLYGKSGRNRHIREMAKQAVAILNKEQSLDHQELAERLGIGFDKYQKPKRTFYFVINPLKKVQLIKDKRVYKDGKKKSYKTMYYIDASAFNGYMKRIIDETFEKIKEEN